MLGKLCMLFPKAAVLAVTATATEAVADDIVCALHLRTPVLVSTSLDRANFFLEVRTSSESLVCDVLCMLKEDDGPTLIFTRTGTLAQEWHNFLIGITSLTALKESFAPSFIDYDRLKIIVYILDHDSGVRTVDESLELITQSWR